MTVYEKNMLVLKDTRMDLYEKMQQASKSTFYAKIYSGVALDNEKFLAIVDEEKIVPLASTYSPVHEAEIYASQYREEWDDVSLVLFGFGNIETVVQIMSDACPIQKCIVYEPSIEIFRKVMEEYLIEELLSNPNLLIIVEGINENLFEKALDEASNYRNWKNFYFTTFWSYERLFGDKLKEIRKIYDRIMDNKQSELKTLSHFAKAGLENEIRAFYWMIEGKTLDSMVGIFPADLPCIVVAAGPSLEKNANALKQAKGKAFIICVDTALNYLLERGIIPDMTCTVDPQKGIEYFTNSNVADIPIAVSTDSDYRVLDEIGEVKPVYLSTTNDFAQRLYKDRGLDVEYFDGGGSVGTVCFQLGVRLGFKTIVIVGQDLAFTDHKAHVGLGKAKEKDLFYNMLMVDGYYGDKVLTRADFKYYIDWYNLRIPQLKDIMVINATEGGAKLNGAIQMPLQECIDKYCNQACDVEKMIADIPETWSTREDKVAFYNEIKLKHRYFIGFRKRLQHGVESARRALHLLERKSYSIKELHAIDKTLDALTEEISQKEGILILVKRMIDVDTSLNDDLLDTEENLELESIRLYKKMKLYLQTMLDALDEMLPIWKETMGKINEKYHFE